MVVASVDLGYRMLMSGPDIVSRGFVYVREAEELMDQAKEIARKAIEDCFDHNIDERTEIKSSVKNALSKFIFQQTGRKPMILPIIMDIYFSANVTHHSVSRRAGACSRRSKRRPQPRRGGFHIRPFLFGGKRNNDQNLEGVARE